MTMQIWVDADACPAVIKDILYRVAERVQMQVTLVANQLLRVPPSRFIRALQVPSGADVADREIVRLLEPGDLVLTMRAFMDELRGSGVDTGGPPPFSQSDRQSFANSLDRHLRKVMPPRP